MAKTKILYITHEMSPFLELSKISEVTRQLPQAMQEKGYEIRILMPRFGNINERRNRLHEVIRLSGMNIVVDNNDNPLIIKVASIPSARMQVYFLDNEEYFQRKHVFCDECGNFFDDNHERMVFFCKGALETVKKLGWAPDVIHCHGWMSALVPAYVKTAYKDDPTFKDTKVVYSLYKEDSNFSLGEQFASIAVTGNMTDEDIVPYRSADYEGLYRGALAYSDAVVLTASDLQQELLNIVKKQGIPAFEVDESEEFENYCNLYEQFSSVELDTAVEA